MRILDWFNESRGKGKTRYENPGLLAFYWDGSSAEGKRVKEVSMTGAYLLTDERWYPGTTLEVTLKRDEGDSEDRIAPHFGLLCQVLRNGEDGIAVRFLANGRKKMLEQFIRSTIANRRAEDSAGQATGTTGQALVELALVVPMLFMLMVLAISFGGLINAWIAVGNASRAAADYAILGGASAGTPRTATSTALQNLINADMASLPNLSSSNPQACIRRNDNYNASTNPGGLVTLLEMPSGACASYSNPPSDPEAISAGSTLTYADVAVDVTYTYTPFLSTNSVMGLPIPALPTSIHRRTVMRVLQ